MGKFHANFWILPTLPFFITHPPPLQNGQQPQPQHVGDAGRTKWLQCNIGEYAYPMSLGFNSWHPFLQASFLRTRLAAQASHCDSLMHLSCNCHASAPQMSLDWLICVFVFACHPPPPPSHQRVMMTHWCLVSDTRPPFAQTTSTASRNHGWCLGPLCVWQWWAFGVCHSFVHLFIVLLWDMQQFCHSVYINCKITSRYKYNINMKFIVQKDQLWPVAQLHEDHLRLPFWLADRKQAV